MMHFRSWRASVLSSRPNLVPRVAWIEQRLDRCESDLERLFLVALAHWTENEGVWTFRGEYAPGSPSAGRFFVVDVEQQVSVANYRCDFMLTVRSHFTDRTKRIAVECDGHSFHDRTKDHASRDRRRDRVLASQGVTTLRYTYSDLVGDPSSAMEDLSATVMALGRATLGYDGIVESDYQQVLNRIDDPAAKKIIIMFWFERAEITGDETTALIKHNDLVHA